MKLKNFILAAALAGAPAAAMAQMHAPTPMTKTQFESAPIGSPVQIVVRVESVARESLKADLLSPVDASHYKPAGATLELYFTADTPIVMGNDADVKPAAVLYVYAVSTSRDRADVKKIVVVTPYATVL